MKAYAILEHAITPYLEAVGNASTEDIQAANDRFGGEEVQSIITRDNVGGKASITIEGVLTPKGPSAIARFFGYGGTGYDAIIEAANELKNDPTVTEVALLMDTPGGSVKGLDTAWQALSELAKEKTLIAENHGQIASGGYYLATAAHRIEAMSPLSETGSIGVVYAAYDFSESDKKDGIKRIKIVSSNAPNKQPDPTTAAGERVIQDNIDAIERVFIAKIVEGRNLSEQHVLDNFGKGGMLIASDPGSNKPDALSVGMIDSVVTQEIDNEQNVNKPPKIGVEDKRRVVMDLNELKTAHPALHAEVLANGVTMGVTQEKERASAHLILGQASGDMEYAVSCIESGEALTPTVSAKHQAASMNNQSVEDRADESEDDLDTAAASAEQHDTALAQATADALGVDLDG